ncbi:MAG: hypothetical protein HDT42_02720 [Ruminococcaceae bacterium]|nr:hypothetical protein [Oscillospiraceae bacterium]
MNIDFSPLRALNNGGASPVRAAAQNTLPHLQALSDENRAKLEEAARMRTEYQKNIRLSDSLRCEINKGLKSGEDIYSLFLKAAKAISLMTSDTIFYDTVKNDLLAIYGIGLEKPPVLQIELNEVQARLDRLRQAAEREQDTDDVARIGTAIQYHEKAIERIKDKIEKSQGG